MGYVHCNADQCYFFDWEDGALSLILLCVYDCLLTGPKEKVLKAKTKFIRLFDCKDIGEMKEYVGCVIERGKGWLKMTQPTQLWKFEDEFDLQTH